MKAIIRWRVGEKVIEDASLGDPRIAEALDQLAARRAQGVALTFETGDHGDEDRDTDDYAMMMGPDGY